MVPSVRANAVSVSAESAVLVCAELFLPEPGGLRVFADAENGNTAEVPLSRHTVIDTDGIVAIRVVFTEKQAAIAEIVTVSRSGLSVAC